MLSIGLVIGILVLVVSVGVTVWEFNDLVSPILAPKGTLEASFDAPEQGRQAGTWEVTVTIKNIGDKPAKDITIRVPASNVIKGDQSEISLIQPDESKKATLQPEIKSTAQLGKQAVTAIVTMEGSPPIEHEFTVDVILPS